MNGFMSKKKLKWYHWAGLVLAAALGLYAILVVIALISITRALTSVGASAPMWERLKLGAGYPLGGGSKVALEAAARAQAGVVNEKKPCSCKEAGVESPS